MVDSHELAMALRAAYLAMHRRTDAALVRHGVTADQFVVLSLLAAQDGVMQQELVRRASSDPNTLRAIVVLLEGQGQVIRKPHPTDGRARTVWLTANGKRIYQRLLADSEPIREILAQTFDPLAAQNLIGFLRQITGAMTADPNSNHKNISIKQRQTSKNGKVHRNVSTLLIKTVRRNARPDCARSDLSFIDNQRAACTGPTQT